MKKEEHVLIIMKPDCIARGLVGEITHRFERKGLRIVGMKMVRLEDVLLEDHYAHLADKPFFAGIKKYMKSAPVVLMAIAGIEAVGAVRLLAGPTKGYQAPAGTIRGDFSLSTQSNIVHASDTVENGEKEVARFFKKEELFDYARPDRSFVYSDENE